jgi:hypothetical protein
MVVVVVVVVVVVLSLLCGRKARDLGGRGGCLDDVGLVDKFRLVNKFRFSFPRRGGAEKRAPLSRAGGGLRTPQHGKGSAWQMSWRGGRGVDYVCTCR